MTMGYTDYGDRSSSESLGNLWHNAGQIGSGLAKVVPAKVGWTVRAQELVIGIDVVEIVHETEWGVVVAVGIVIEIIDRRDSEFPNLVHAGLVTTIEILRACMRLAPQMIPKSGYTHLASELGHAVGLVKPVRPFFHVGL